MIVSNKTNNAFATIINRALKSPDTEKVIFATEPGESFENSTKLAYPALVFIIKGSQNIRYYRNGSVIDDLLLPGQALFIGKFCPSALDWRRPCSRLGAVCGSGMAGMSWNHSDLPITHLDVLPALWFSSPLPAYNDLDFLFSALHARSDYPADSKATCMLPQAILHILRELTMSRRQTYSKHGLDTYQKICLYLETNYNQLLNRKLVADIFQLNPDYVTRLFKEKGNVLFSDYLTNLRLSKAEELLRQGELPIQQVATLSGFANSSYFIKVFRKKHGCSPGNYRQQ